MNRRRDDGDRTVWSSEQGGRVGGKPQRSPRKHPRDAGPPSGRTGDPADGIVRVRLDKKGRKGKAVSTVSGVALPEAELRDLAGDLKRRCGSGGALKDGVIEIQGDHRDTLVAFLEDRGFRVKRAGG